MKRALASDRPPVYQRPLKGSAVDAVEPAIRELLKQTPTKVTNVRIVASENRQKAAYSLRVDRL
ncbi:hypothetical protein [Kitasatospora sp. NPDC093558]|uniref:hypothetical protein n=1 Tax=Kitasatospora sp. NPDC093558 TaxID=3155201 RepID=UPI00342C0465